jgi:hypothetical protein
MEYNYPMTKVDKLAANVLTNTKDWSMIIKVALNLQLFPASKALTNNK